MSLLFVSMARATRVKIMLVLVAIILLSVDGATTARGRKTLTDLEIRRQLKRINKPAVKTIKSEGGDIIDCVDIYKQPAFDHPLLRNHTIQMKPSNYDSEKKFASKPIEQLWHKRGSCSEGTIPILRTRKSDLLRAISLEANGIKAFTPGMESAKVRAEGDLKNFKGGEALINVWNVHVEGDESSTASMFIGRTGSSDFVNSGWIVSNGVFGDNKTRLYAYWASDNSGCYNLKCPGFVQTSTTVGLGVEIAPLSTYDGDQYDVDVKIYKDPKADQWWLEFNHEPVGYWPSSLFKDMKVSADFIEWGGQVSNTVPGGQHTSTQMGSGHFSNEGFKKSAFFDQCVYFGTLQYGETPSLYRKLVSKSDCYDVSRVGQTKDKAGLSFYYGGPGGPNCDK